MYLPGGKHVDSFEERVEGNILAARRRNIEEGRELDYLGQARVSNEKSEA